MLCHILISKIEYLYGAYLTGSPINTPTPFLHDGSRASLLFEYHQHKYMLIYLYRHPGNRDIDNVHTMGLACNGISHEVISLESYVARSVMSEFLENFDDNDLTCQMHILSKYQHQGDL